MDAWANGAYGGDQMSALERELREVLQREQPSAGFDRRVLERAALARRSQQRQWKWISTAVAACLVIGLTSVYWQRERQAERAQEQLVQALQITAQKLALVERMATKNLTGQEK